jgi:hypothetical protein
VSDAVVTLAPPAPSPPAPSPPGDAGSAIAVGLRASTVTYEQVNPLTVNKVAS